MKIHDINPVTEGWETLPPINRDRYGDRNGLEGPFQTRAGKVVYYDPREGAYYDPDSDMYLTYDEWRALDESLPPHLAKHFDKDGDPVDGEWINGEFQPGTTKKKMKPTWKDVTPKGYGVEEDIASSDPNVYSYFIQQKIGGSPGSEWSIFTYNPEYGGNPTHLSKMLQAHAKSLGWDGYNVIAMWKGDIDQAYNNASEKLASDKKWITSYENELKKTVNDIDNAKQIMATGDQGQTIASEARDPRAVIGKFLKQKDAKAVRSAELAKDPSKVKQMTMDKDLEEDNLNEYKPGVTTLTRTLTLEPEEIKAIKKDIWKAGIEVKVRGDQVTFKTAKIKTLAKILNKHIDFGATDVGAVLDIPAEIGPIDEDGHDQLGTSRQSIPKHELMRKIERALPYMEPYGVKEKVLAAIDKVIYTYNVVDEGTEEMDEAEVGDKVKYRNIKTKRNKSGVVDKVRTDKHGNKNYELRGTGKVVYDSDLEEAGGAKKVIIATKGKKTDEFALPPHMTQPHHIAQELRKRNLPIPEVELHAAARDLARGKVFRNGDIAMKVQDHTPREMESVEENLNENPWNQPGQTKPTGGTLPAPKRGQVPPHNRKWQEGDKVIPHTGPLAGKPHIVVSSRRSSVNIVPRKGSYPDPYGMSVRAKHNWLTPAEGGQEAE